VLLGTATQYAQTCCPSDRRMTTNPTLSILGLNTGVCGDKPSTKVSAMTGP